MRLSGMGRALELLLIPIRVLYEWTFSLSLSLSRLSYVYARKHSSRHKVERLVYYFRYVAMWSDSEILERQVVCLDKDRKRDKKKQNAFKGNWHYWVCFVLIYLFISNSCVLIDCVSFSLTFCSRLNGSVVYIFEMNRWRD